MPLQANKVAELKQKLDRLRAGTKSDFQTIMDEVIADISSPTDGANVAQMAELMAYAVHLIDDTLGVPTEVNDAGLPKPRTGRRMSQVSQANPIQPLLGAALVCEQYYQVTLDPDTNATVYAAKGAATLRELINEFENLLSARVKYPDVKLADGNPPPPPQGGGDDDDIPTNQVVVSVVSAEIDADILNRRGAKVFAKNPAKRLFDQKEYGHEDQPIDVVATLEVLMSKFERLKSPDQELMSKPVTGIASNYDEPTTNQNFADIAEIYQDRVQWIYDKDTRADQLYVTAKKTKDGYDTVATLTLTEDSAILILDSDIVMPAVAGSKATNRQAAGRSLQELLLQTSRYVNEFSEVTPKFMHVYTPNTSGNPIRNSNDVDVESLVNTCMTVVLASQNIPTFDDQTKQAFRNYCNNPAGKQEVKVLLVLIYNIEQAAKSGTSAAKLNALEIYNEHMSRGPDDPYAAKARNGIDNTRSRL